MPTALFPQVLSFLNVFSYYHDKVLWTYFKTFFQLETLIFFLGFFSFLFYLTGVGGLVAFDVLWVNRCPPSSCMRAKQQQQQRKQESGYQQTRIPHCLISSVSPPPPPYLLIPSLPLSSSHTYSLHPTRWPLRVLVFFFPSAGEKKVCMTGGEGTRRLHQCLSTLQKYSCQKSRADVPNPSIKFHTTQLQLQRSVCQLMCRSQTRKAAAECGVNDRSQCKSREAHPFVSPSWDQRHAYSLPLHPYKEPRRWGDCMR